MNKSILASCLVISSIAATVALADPSSLIITFNCPTVTGTDIHALSNFGTYIAGYGTETIAGSSTSNAPYFKYIIPSGANIPAKINTGSYIHNGTDFNSVTSTVSCSYQSFGGFDSFTVSYTLTNGAGGVIVDQLPDYITIIQYLGLRK